MEKITIVRGDDSTINLTIQNSEGVAFNLTGATLFFTVKENKDDVEADALIQKSTTSHVTAASGITKIDLTVSDTDLDPGVYWYDFQVKDTNGKITSTQSGEFEVLQDITQRTS